MNAEQLPLPELDQPKPLKLVDTVKPAPEQLTLDVTIPKSPETPASLEQIDDDSAEDDTMQWRLDAETIAIGLKGVREARKELKKHPKPLPPPELIDPISEEYKTRGLRNVAAIRAGAAVLPLGNAPTSLKP